MKLLVDFFPIILFFVAFKTLGIFAATAVAIVAPVAQIGWLRWRNGRVEPMQWLSLGVIVVFGGATLVAQDETFIKWKPTVLYWLMGGGSVCVQTQLHPTAYGGTSHAPHPCLGRVAAQLGLLFCPHGLPQYLGGQPL